MSQSAIIEWVGRSSFVFAGTVTSPGQSSLRALPAKSGLAVVRLDRGLLVNPVLGKLDGRPITVQLGQGGAGTGAVRTGERLIFFTTAWVHGEEIAVRELARLPAETKTEEEVARVVASLPERHLAARIATAVLIVHGIVTEIAPATGAPRTASEHDPGWMRALIEVHEALKGKAEGAAGRARRQTAVLLFPGSRDLAFRNVPRPTERQDAVFLLHQPSPGLPAGAHIAPDPADIQPTSALSSIRQLLGTSPPPAAPR